MKKILTVLLLFWAVLLTAQDAELTNYKGGIDVVWGGTKGTAYQEEYWYHDKLIWDIKTVFIRDTTTITMGHNERNIASLNGSRDKSVIGASGGGQIRYKLDKLWRKDMWAPWSDGSGSLNPAYTGPFTLAAQNYETGIPVVGTTGWYSSGSYWRGMIDSAGDEWHIMMYGDDDSSYAGFSNPGNSDAWASDGKWVALVVNPKTPAMTVRSSGTGQFYTTPAWTYWVPKIHDQTTYFQGTCTFELKNIYGGNISYRINGGSTVNVGAATVTLDQDDFSDGSNTLEYWYTATPSVVRTRTVVENPTHPGASESHGERVWGPNAWTNFSARATKPIYSDVVADMQTEGETKQAAWDTKAKTGLRFGGANWPHKGGPSAKNAIMAHYLGFNAVQSGSTKSYAAYAKEMLLESALNQCVVGIEGNPWHGVPMPCADTVYRGYWDSGFAYGPAITYDTLMDGYRSDQHADGITPIEDYFIRDRMANWVHFCALQLGDFWAGVGMWPTCRAIGATMITCVMPNYSTPYYGTSGLNGNTTVYTWAPFQTYNYTWKKLFLEHDNSLHAFGEGPVKGFGLEGDIWSKHLIRPAISESEYTGSNGEWIDKGAYASFAQCGLNISYYAMLWKLYDPSRAHPNLLNYIDEVTIGTVYPSKGTPSAFRIHMATLINEYFPQAAANAQSWMQGLSPSDTNSDDYVIGQVGYPTLFWYDDTYYGGTPTPTVATPVISPSGSSGNSSPISVTITCATGSATIRYTTDGSDPDSSDSVYTSALNISSTTTVKARGFLSGYNDSGVAAQTYGFGSVPGVPTGLAASNVTANTVDLSWNTASGTVTGYKVYKNGANPETTTSTQYTVQNLNSDTSYTFTVSAYNSNGDSSQSSGVNVTTSSGSGTPEVLSEDQPVSVSSTSGGYSAANAVDGDMGTRWSSNYEDEEWIQVDLGAIAQITQVVLDWEYAYGLEYKIEVSDDASSNSWTTIVWETSGNGGNDTHNVSGSGRYVRMLGIDRGTQYGYSLYEFEISGVYGSVDNQDPTTPTGLTASNITSTTVDLSWNASTDNIGVTGYKVYINGSNPESTGSTSYTVENLNPSTSYTFTVTAVDAAANESDPSSGANATTASSGGTPENLALSQSVTASSTSGGHSASNAVDGSMSTRWSSNFNDSESITVDLGAIAQITKVELEWETAYGLEYKIEVSDDGSSNWTTIVWETSGNGGNDTHDSLSGSGRYVRMLGIDRGTQWGYSLYEFEVWGMIGGGSDTEEPITPTGLTIEDAYVTSIDLSWNASSDNVGVTGYNVYVDDVFVGTVTETEAQVGGLDPDTTYAFKVSAVDAAENESALTSAVSGATTEPSNIALGQSATASSYDNTNRQAPKAVDGSMSTRWSSTFSDDQLIEVDLGAISTIVQVVLKWEYAYGLEYEIQVSDDASNWTTVFTEDSGDGGTDQTPILDVTGRYVRMQGILRATQYGYSLYEFEVWGE